jgi:hypothetical protein
MSTAILKEYCVFLGYTRYGIHLAKADCQAKDRASLQNPDDDLLDGEEEKVVVYWGKKFRARSERENKKSLDFPGKAGRIPNETQKMEECYKILPSNKVFPAD